MTLIRDEQAYLRMLDDFVARRVAAAVFIARFQHQWQGDGADVPATPGATPDRAGLRGLLDSIATLCATYAQTLPSGCGYRVSEEQFRKEVESLTHALPRPGAGLA